MYEKASFKVVCSWTEDRKGQEDKKTGTRNKTEYKYMEIFYKIES